MMDIDEKMELMVRQVQDLGVSYIEAVCKSIILATSDSNFASIFNPDLEDKSSTR